MPLLPVPPPALVRDLRFPELKAWVIQRTGLSYYQDKDGDLAAGLIRAFPGAATLTAGEILQWLDRVGGQELDRAVEELTIGETFFFRHLEMFKALGEVVFPDLAKRKRSTRSLRIWSAGCSVGAETYSLSIMLREQLAEHFADWAVHMLGTDINRRFLERAEEATYEHWALRGLSEETLTRCFDQQGKKWTLKPQFRRDVNFRHHNLAANVFPSPEQDMFGFDLIICRNVMIYFDQVTIRRLADQFYRSLVPGGWLIVGHAEPQTETFKAFRTVNAPGAVLYQRPGLEDRWDLTDISWTAPVLGAPTRPQRKAPVPVTLASTAQPSPPPTRPPVALGAEGLDQVRSLAEAGDLEAANRLCAELVGQDSLNAAPHLYHAQVLLQLGRWAEAESAVRRCLYLRRDLAIAHFYLGLVLENTGARDSRSFRNALTLLESRADTELVEFGDGVSVGELMGMVSAHLAGDHS